MATRLMERLSEIKASVALLATFPHDFGHCPTEHPLSLSLRRLVGCKMTGTVKPTFVGLPLNDLVSENGDNEVTCSQAQLETCCHHQEDPVQRPSIPSFRVTSAAGPKGKRWGRRSAAHESLRYRETGAFLRSYWADSCSR